MATTGGGPPVVVLILQSDATARGVHDELRSALPDVVVERVSSREEVLALLGDAERPVDLVVSDQGTPDSDRLRDLHRVRAFNHRTAFLVINRDHAGPAEVDEAGLAALNFAILDEPDDAEVAARAVAMAVELSLTGDGIAARYDQLIGCLQQLSLADDLPRVTVAVQRAARELTAADGVILVLREGDQGFIPDGDTSVEEHLRGIRFPLDRSINGWAMLNRQPAVVPDVTVDPRVPAVPGRSGGAPSLVVVPIGSADPIGAISVHWQTARDIPVSDVRLLQALADTTGLVLEKIRQQECLERRVAERTDELESFTYAVSHDLQAPIRQVAGFTAMAQRRMPEDAPDRVRDYLRATADAAERMHDMVDALLQLSRAGRRDLERTRTDAAEVARDVVERCRATAEHTVAYDGPEHLWVDADPAFLRTILGALLGNAWKFTARTPDARVTLSTDRTVTGETALHVQDNGAGFDPDEAGRLFRVFQRLHDDEQFAGTGVGLALVKRAVSRHGGSVWAEGAPGQGARFSFTLGAPSTAPGAPVVPQPRSVGVSASSTAGSSMVEGT